VFTINLGGNRQIRKIYYLDRRALTSGTSGFMYHLHGELPAKVTAPDADKIKKLSKLDNKDVSNVC